MSLDRRVYGNPVIECGVGEIRNGENIGERDKAMAFKERPAKTVLV